MPALLVSVRNAAEARSAIEGGCDILDVKEPTRGSLGMADLAAISTVIEVRNKLAPTMTVSVALGEATDWEGDSTSLKLPDFTSVPPRESRADPERSRRFPAGIDFVKLGTAFLGNDCGWRERIHRARAHCQALSPFAFALRAPEWVSVAYADWRLARAPEPAEVVTMAADGGFRGVLIDTFAKTGRGLLEWMTVEELERLVASARKCGLWLALAGRLTLDDIAIVLGICPDIVGVRSAACSKGLRNGDIDSSSVRRLREALTGRNQS